jgi:hypothetical protein
MFFIGTLENPNWPNYGHWIMKEYTYNENKKQFVYQNSHNLYSIPGRCLGDMFKYHDADHNEHIMLNTYDPGGSSYLGTINTQGQFKYVSRAKFENRDYAASTMVKGTIKGKRNNPAGSKEDSDRFTVFLISEEQNSAHNNPVYHYEYSIQNNILQFVTSGEVVLPSSSYPKDINNIFNIHGVIQYDVMDFSTEVTGPDGIRQHVWLFYPDSHKSFTGARFKSDIWRPVPGSVVSSTDLGDVDKYGDSIKDLWSLVGIVDGAPPCSINWHVWDSIHDPDAALPTELKFSTAETHKTEVKAFTQDMFSAGADVHFGVGPFAAGVEFKYSNTFKEMHSSSTKISKEYTLTYGLNDESQEYGVYIWMIPQIKRISYNVYPWWDNQLQYPVSNSLQYLFRTFGFSYHNEKIEISKFPFLIDEPNAVDLAAWKVDRRSYHYNNILKYDLSPFTDIFWEDPYQGSEGSFSEVKDTTSAYSSSNSYEVTVSASGSLPEIFSAGINVGTEVDYENEVTVTTEFSKTLTVSLNNLIQKKYGINISHLDISAYWFRPEHHHAWWYYDSLINEQKPWYIAYIVNTCEGKILPLLPVSNGIIKESELLFSWELQGAEFKDLTFFVANSTPISQSNILHKEDVTVKRQINPDGFQPEKGKTYYWAIRGICESGDLVWSPTQAFTILDDEISITEKNDLKAIIYPNPSNQKNIHVIIDSPEPSRISLSLFDITGRYIHNREFEHNASGPTTIMLSNLDLTPGVYFVVIRSNQSSITKKLIITNSY